jgi:uncharacterized protein (TIGR02118 family)
LIGALSLLQHRPQDSLDAFRHHWRNVHGPLAAELHGVKRYAQSHFLRDDLLTNALARRLDVDGLAAISFDNEEDREICYASHQEEICDVDSLLFIGATARYVTDVHTQIAAKTLPAPFKAVLLVLQDTSSVSTALDNISAVNGLTGLIVHKVTKSGAEPTQARKQIDLPLHSIIEVSTVTRTACEQMSRLFGPEDNEDVAIFAAQEHCIV